MRKSGLLGISCLFLATAGSVGRPAMAGASGARPVYHGGAGDCLEAATVRGLNPGGDNYLSVRAAPNRRARELGRLREGHFVWFCRGSVVADWVGVIYPETKNGLLPEFEAEWTCKASTHSGNDGPRRPYRGPCRSGWVAKRYIMLSAG